MKHKKIMLKLLAIVLSITNLLNVVPVKTYAADKLIDDFQSNDTVVSEKIKSNGGLICVTAVCTIVFYKLFSKLCRELYMFLLNPIVKEIEYNFIKESYEREFEGQIEKNILTKRQEGVGWCWIACLQGLLKEKEIEKSQEEIFKEITGKKPGWFEHTRNECLSPFENIEEVKNSPYGYIYNSNEYVYLGQIKNYVKIGRAHV